MWVLLDNYDSFSHILHHYLLQTGNECIVYRNDALSLQQLVNINPSRLIISPGPETPLQAGICMESIAHFYNRIPILGVCLGHQALGMFYGAQLQHAPYPMHGKTSSVQHNGHSLFAGIDTPFTVMRYHSLVIDIPANSTLQPIAYATDDNAIMAIAHNTYPSVGVQFHPESIGTQQGLQLLYNWANMYL